jgi:CubicO group peptidase (beta-lactamase class C family)
MRFPDHHKLAESAVTNLKLAVVLVIGSVLIATHPTVAQQPAKAMNSQPNEGDVQGMSSERLARIAPAMKAQVDNGVFPGAVTMVARNGQLLHFEAHGFLDDAKSKPMPKDALFRLASMTKPIVSVAAVMMIERGDMKLHDPVSLWLPELKDVKVETRKVDKDGKETVEDVAPIRRSSFTTYFATPRVLSIAAPRSRRASRRCTRRPTSRRATARSPAMRC